MDQSIASLTYRVHPSFYKDTFDMCIAYVHGVCCTHESQFTVLRYNFVPFRPSKVPRFDPGRDVPLSRGPVEFLWS